MTRAGDVTQKVGRAETKRETTSLAVVAILNVDWTTLNITTTGL
jgi:hypothetical protein